jgi:signal transduction histidine kinase
MSNTSLNRQQLESILRNAADGITVQDPNGKLIFANEAAADAAGFDSVGDLLAASGAEITQRFEVFDESGEALPPERWPGAMALREKEPCQAVLRYRDRATDEERWSVIRSTPVFDEVGQLQYEVSATQDITEVMRGEARLRLLAEASELLGSSLDFDATLASVARLAVAQLADWAAVDLVEPGGVIRRLSVACADRVTEDRAGELQSRYPPRLDAGFGPGRVVDSGQPLLIRDVSEQMLIDTAVDAENLRLLREIGMRSVMVAPLRARGRVLGAVTFISVGSERRYSRVDLTLATELANCAALAVDNARLYQEARDAVLARDRVIATVSHDLRTPLTTIRGMAQVLLRRVDRSSSLSAPQVMERLSLLDRAAAQMNTLMDDILDLARIEAGRPLELNLESTDLLDLVTRTLEEIRNEDTSYQFILNAKDSNVTGEWDARRIARVLRNLLKNATKFSPEGSPITIELRSVNGDADTSWIELLVRDEGVGISPLEQALIFSRRYDRRTPGQPGYVMPDIGLAGARQIAEQHGGTLTVSSDVGEGSTFVLRLPVARVSTGVQG